MSGRECPEPLPADRRLHPKPLIEENSYENARLYCEVGESEKGIAEAREQQFLIPELVKRIPHPHFVYVGLMRGPMIEHYEGLLEAQRAAGTVPVSTLPPRVSQLPFDGK